jgi:glycosyltransferase involved in cell wall biosynthesis
MSIVVPALDEVDNVKPLVDQIDAAMKNRVEHFELLVVDDGSTDSTDRALADLMPGRPWLRVLRRPAPMGQSAAMRAGILAARGTHVATLDADLQNDPADLPDMLDRLHADEADFVQGDRSRNRRDSFLRRRASWVGRFARRTLLRDPVRDTGCSARVLRADLAKQLPLQFKGMHRFFPAYARILGARIVEHPVRHRPREAGQTKYGVGVLTRGLGGLMDLLAVRWMSRRLRDASAHELPRQQDAEDALP